MTFFRSRIFVACVASTVTALVVGGVAWAVQSPVDGSGVIHACYNTTNGNLHLNVTGACPRTGQNTPIMWSVTGPQGVQGPQGPTSIFVLSLSATPPTGGGPSSGIDVTSGGSQVSGCNTNTAPGSTSCNLVLAAGVTVSLQAGAAAGGAFDHWTGACAGSTNQFCYLTMNSNESAGAVFG